MREPSKASITLDEKVPSQPPSRTRIGKNLSHATQRENQIYNVQINPWEKKNNRKKQTRNNLEILIGIFLIQLFWLSQKEQNKKKERE